MLDAQPQQVRNQRQIGGPRWPEFPPKDPMEKRQRAPAAVPVAQRYPQHPNHHQGFEPFQQAGDKGRAENGRQTPTSSGVQIADPAASGGITVRIGSRSSPAPR